MVTIRNYIDIDVGDLSKGEWQRLFRNLRYMDAERNVYEPWRIMRSKEQVRIPRGAWFLLPDHVQYQDQRSFPRARKHEFKIELDAKLPDGREFTGQKRALAKMIEQEQGILIRQPGSGKTQIVLAFVAQVGTITLVLVHTDDLIAQWQQYAKDAIPEIKVGLIQGPTVDVQQLTLATVQTFSNILLENPKKWRDVFGAVILDEAHHAAAVSFERCLNLLAAKYRFGVTASPTRADGRHPYMQLVIGPIIYKQKYQSPVPVEVIPLKSGFKFNYRGRMDWGRLQEAITLDEDRNALIASQAVREAKKGHSVLILSRRIEHINQMYDHIALAFEFDEGWLQLVEILTGERSKKDRRRILKDFRSGKVRVVLATQLADEGLDIPRLSRVFLTYPGKHDGRLLQQVGRALREHTDKTDARIYDVVDDRIMPLRRQWMKRKQWYKSANISIRKRKVA